MSGIINKVKDAVTGHHKDTSASTTEPGVNDYDTSRTGHSGGLTGSEDYTSDPYKAPSGHGQGLTGSGNYSSDKYGSDSQRAGNPGYGSTDTGTRGPHSSNLENKLDPRVDSDGSRATSGVHGSSGTGNTGYGTTSSGLGSTGASTTAGPHSSDLANKADPRVDSDLDGRRGYDSSNTSGGYGSGVTGHGTSTTAGPHSSNLANKADPRVDSDLDGRRGYDSSNTSGGYGSGVTGSGASTTAGPHSSNLLNKADPRVDSDLDGRRGYESSNTSGGYGSGTTGQGLTGGETGYSGTTEHGHHGRHGHVEDIVHGGAHHTETANKLDPQVAGGGATETVGGYGSGSGSGSGTHHQDTAGPHKSNVLNKLDPRVDSDRDGSNTYGGNRTTVPHQGVNVGTTDASVAFELLGGSKNADAEDNRAGRNGPKLADDLRKYGNGM